MPFSPSEVTKEACAQVFPELPVPKAGENVDKVQQYTDDFAETKKRLEEARQRRLMVEASR